MEIEIDFSQMSTDNPWQVAWFLFINGGWLVFVIVTIWALFQFWFTRQRMRYHERWEWTLLSIDIPKINEQTPRAVEYIFTSLSGTWKRIDWFENFFLGKIQISFSFELISRGGSIEYLIRVPRHYRDLVEASVYAQYPNAEISEVADYTERFTGVSWPDNDQGWDVWGTKIKQSKKYFYPIRTWQTLFEADKTTVKDPLSSILEIMSKLRQGEEFWFQVVVTPTSNSWKDKGQAYVRRLLGQTQDTGSGITGWLSNITQQLLDAVIYSVIAKPEVEVSSGSTGPELLEKESEAIKGIQEKTSKIGLRTHMRAVYLARREVFNKNKIKEGFLGALHQFTDLHANGFIQDENTKVSGSHLYYLRNYRVNHFRKNKILAGYRKRSSRTGPKWGTGFILNVEELASIWHFPLGDMSALVIKKADFKKAEAPFALPVEVMDDGLSGDNSLSASGVDTSEPDEVFLEEEQGPPDNLPVG